MPPALATPYDDFFALWKDANSDIPILSKPKLNTQNSSSS
jgi:hypothetical protein